MDTFSSSFLLLCLFLLSCSSALAAVPPSSAIQQACRATRFRDSCQSSLSNSHDLPASHTPRDFILSAMKVSAQHLQTAKSMVQALLHSAGSDKNRTNGAQSCLEFLAYSDYRLNLSSQPDNLSGNRTKDARAWLSASLVHQHDCLSALEYVSATREVESLIRLSEHTSNALSMLVAFDRLGPDTGAWRPPQTERDGYQEDMTVPPPPPADHVPRFPGTTEANVTVCKEGCDYATVQAAVDAAPANLPFGGFWFTLYIKEGVYEETVVVPLEKTNLVFIGDGYLNTIITGSRDDGTAAVGVYGDGFMAQEITFQNTAGPMANEAVAFRNTADRTFVAFCQILGYRHALHAHALRQYYFANVIEGTTDFVYGNAAAVFESGGFNVRPRPVPAESSALTAHGRTDPAQSTGFVITDAIMDGTVEYMSLFRKNHRAYRAYLGRPEGEYARTVFVRTLLEAIIGPEGWMPRRGDFALKTLYYAEGQSQGPGAKKNLSRRVSWSSQLPWQKLVVYRKESFIQGDAWIPVF